MNDITLHEALPVVLNLAERKAHAFVRRCRLSIDEREDVESQLVLTFLTRWPQFDNKMAGVRTFASRVMDHELVSILRYRLAGRRRHLGAFLTDDDRDDSGEGCPTGLSITRRMLAEQQHFWLDIERVLMPLPGILLETAYGLSRYTPSELSFVHRRSRTIVYQRMRRLREALLEAGIGPDYFTTSAGVQ